MKDRPEWVASSERVAAANASVEPVRSAHAHTGLGVTALGATGERIVVEGTVKLRSGAKVAATEAPDLSATAAASDGTDSAPPSTK